MKERKLTFEEWIALERGKPVKIFISWSGDKSKEIAVMLSNWLRCVLQILKPWMSENNIESGSMWFQRICEELKDTANSIVVVTKENKNSPWIMFEAGAASKGDSANRVTILATDLRPEDVPQPLGAFHCAVPTKEGMKKLVFDINKRIDEVNGECESTVYDDTLEKTFELWYPEFEKQFNDIMGKYGDMGTIDNRTDMERKQDEILSSVRTIERTLVETRDQVKINTASHIVADVIAAAVANTAVEKGSIGMLSQVAKTLNDKR